MTLWNQDSYLSAWNFAAKIHIGQTLPGSEIPYINHIGLVAMEASAAIANNQDSSDPDLMIQCALLHDALEEHRRPIMSFRGNLVRPSPMVSWR